jgi:hypothetical protein
MSAHAASLQRRPPTPAPVAPAPAVAAAPAAVAVEPLPSASPIDAHLAPVQDTRKRSGRAGGALVLGILALVCAAIPGFGLVLGIFAVTKGASAAADLRRTGQGGRGRAIAGEAMGVVAIAASLAIPILFGLPI